MDQSTKQPRHRSLTCQGGANTHFVFGPNVRPAMSASRSEVIRLETQDCYQGLLTEDPATHQHLQNEKKIPVTGPIHVEDADIGDVLCVHIQQIKLADKGVFVIRPKTGVIGQDIRNQVVRVLPVKSNHLNLTNGISVPLQPVLGIIGVAPRHGEIDTIYPGRHGGNMDTVEISTGARIYLPVQVKGALLSIGDVKASMGDGQIAGSGVEVAAEVTVRIDTLPGGRFSWPRVETKDAWITITSASSVDQASRLAVSEMIRWLEQEKGLDFETAYTLVGISGALRISQWNNPLITARIVFPKSIAQKIRSKSAPSGRPMFLTTMPDISNDEEEKSGDPQDVETAPVVVDAEGEATDTSQKKEEDSTDGTEQKPASRSHPRRRRRRVSTGRRNASQKKTSETPNETAEVNNAEIDNETSPVAVPTVADPTSKSSPSVEPDKTSAKDAQNESTTEPGINQEEAAATEKDEKKPAAKRRPPRRRASTRRPSASSSSNRRTNRKPAENADGKKEDDANQGPIESSDASKDEGSV